MTAGRQHRLHSTSGGRTVRLFSSVCCPCKCKGKPFCNKARQVEAARHTSRKERYFPLGKEEEEHWIIILWVFTLGCKIHLPFFHLPSPSQVLSFSVSTPSSQPCTLCPLCPGLLRATADDSFETRKGKESRDGKLCRGKGSRHCMFMVLITKVQLVGDLYGCAFKLCILHITGNKY